MSLGRTRTARRTLARLAAVALAGVFASGCAVFDSEIGSAPEVAAAAVPLAEQNYERGKWYLAQGKPGLALTAFRLALDEEPGSVRTLNALGASYDSLRRFDLADRYYRRALALDPRSAQTLNNLGYSHLLRGSDAVNLARAQEYLEQARALDAGNTVVAANLARLVEQTPAAEAAPTVASLGGGISIVEPGAAWIERASAVEQRLVTAPDAAVVALARRVGVAPQIATVSLTSSCVGALDCNSLPRSGAVAARPTRLGPATQPAVDSPASGCADALDCMMPLRAGADAAQPPRVDPATQPTVGSPASGCADALDCILPNDSDSVTMPSRHIDYGLQLAAVQPAAGCANALDCMTPLRSGAEAASAEPPVGPAASTLT